MFHSSILARLTLVYIVCTYPQVTFKRESDNSAVSTYKQLMLASSGSVMVDLEFKPQYVDISLFNHVSTQQFFFVNSKSL